MIFPTCKLWNVNHIHEVFLIFDYERFTIIGPRNYIRILIVFENLIQLELKVEVRKAERIVKDENQTLNLLGLARWSVPALLLPCLYWYSEDQLNNRALFETLKAVTLNEQQVIG